MNTETDTKVKYGVWGLILGAAIAIAIGFAWGGWVTRASSQEATDAALLATRAEICGAQFSKAPDYEANLKEFEALDSWKRPDFIEKGGWDKMPGEQEASRSAVKHTCAAGLEVLTGK